MSVGGSLVRDPTKVWRCLQGVFCVFKPPRLSAPQVYQALQTNVLRDLNEMPFPRPKKRVAIEGSLASDEKLSVKVLEDYSSHPLVIGDMFLEEDFTLESVRPLTPYSSGVAVLGVNEEGLTQVEALREAQLLTTHTLEGRLGVATRDYFYTGGAVERSSYGHVSRGRVEKVLKRLLGINRRKMLNEVGVRPDSQEAYEILSRTGLVRPRTTDVPIIYAIKLNKFRPPDFTIEVCGVNLTDVFLLTTINDIGLYCKTNAHTLKLRCMRIGAFQLQHALLRSHWTLQHVIDNLATCRPLVGNLVNEHVDLRKLEDHVEDQSKRYQQNIEEKLSVRRQEEESGRKLLEEY